MRNNFSRVLDGTAALQRTNENHIQQFVYESFTTILRSKTNHENDEVLLFSYVVAQVRGPSSQLLSRKVARRKRMQ